MWMFKHCLQKENVISAASSKNHLERNTIKALLKKKKTGRTSKIRPKVLINFDSSQLISLKTS